MRTYFHVSRKEFEDSIQENGLKSTDADECASGKGIHVTRTIEDASKWADVLRAERNERDTTYVIFALKADTSFEKTDEFPNNAPADGFVLCTNRIPPDRIKPVEWIY